MYFQFLKEHLIFQLLFLCLFSNCRIASVQFDSTVSNIIFYCSAIGDRRTCANSYGCVTIVRIVIIPLELFVTVTVVLDQLQKLLNHFVASIVPELVIVMPVVLLLSDLLIFIVFLVAEI